MVHFLQKHCQHTGHRFICYDPENVGESKVNDITQFEFKHWFEDAKTAINHVVEDSETVPNIILVGHSLGAWISLTMTVSHPELIKGLLLINPPINSLSSTIYQRWFDQAPKLLYASIFY